MGGSDRDQGSTTQQNLDSGASAIIDERTALLSATDRNSYHHGTTTEETLTDEELEERDIDPNKFDNLVARSEVISTGLGIEPESQETAMLRGPRRYSVVRSASHVSSSRRRKSFASTVAGDSGAIEEGGDREIESSEPKKSPFLAGLSSSQFWFIFAGYLASLFVTCFDSTIMVSSHPVITSYFHSSNSASWLSTAFLLTSTAFQPLFGRLSDTIGRKSPYLFCTFLFLIATVWCALAPSMLSFVIARAACGLGAGGMMAMGSIILSDMVPIEIRGVYQSYINIIYGAGSAAGAAFGGLIADSLGWRWEFGIQIPLLCLCLLVSSITIPNNLGLPEGVEKKTLWEAMKVFDIKGSILLTTSVTFLILGLNLGGNVFPWSHPFVIASLVIFSICFPAFIYVESYVELPIMPLKLILKNPCAGLMLANGIGALVTNALLFNIPLYFQAVLLESATSSGLRLIVPSLVSSSFGTATGFLITWTKQLKLYVVVGAIFIFAGAVSLACMQRGFPNWAYLLFLVPGNIGQGFMFPSTFMSVLAVSEQSEQAVVTSTLILWRSMGMVLGVAISSFVLQNSLLIYLELNVEGPDKESVIQAVRKSVRAIAKLAPAYREQVIDSYASSLRVTFLVAAVLSVVAILLTLPLRLPKLGHRK